MSTAFKVSRDLRTLIASEAASGTGILTCTRGKHKRLFCIRDGRVIYAISNIVEEQFDRTLVTEHVLDAATTESIVLQANEAGKKFGAFLLEQSFPPADVLGATMGKHVRRLLDDTNNWTGAQYQFDRGIPNLSGEPLGDVAVVEWLFDSSKSFLSRRPEDIRARIGPPNIRLRLKEDSSALQALLPSNPLIETLLKACDGRTPLRQIESEIDATEVQILQSLHTLRILGIVVPDVESLDSRSGIKPVTREECESRLAQSETATHYLVLGLGNEVTEDEIREAYYELARRFHPDRFRSGVLQDLLPKVERYFAKVTEAYNTLSDSQTRAGYDDLLSEGRTSDDEPTKDAAYLARENYAKAKILIDRRQYQDAVQFLENALGLDTKPLYLIELGRLLIRSPRQRPQALAYLEQATGLDPTNADGWTALGQLHFRSGRPERAREAYEHAIHWDPFHEGANEGIAELGATPKKAAHSQSKTTQQDKDQEEDKKEKKGLFKGLFRS